MSLHLGLEGPEPPAAVVAVAGRMARPVASRPGPRPSVLLAHGSADAVIPAGEMAASARLLRDAGVTVETLLVPGHGHAVHPLQVRAAIAHLGRVLAAPVAAHA